VLHKLLRFVYNILGKSRETTEKEEPGFFSSCHVWSIMGGVSQDRG
jgi:hypothetical protein